MISTCYKVILIGDCRVGKTSILNYMGGKGVNGQTPVPPTIGVGYAPITIKCHGQEVRVNIWDTSGAEKYKAITSSYYRKCQGAVLVFDLTDRKTFVSLRMWLEQLKKIVVFRVTCIVLANKIDLAQSGERERQVKQEEIIDFCMENQLQFKYTSAVTGYNIKEAFNSFIEKVQDQKTSNQQGHASLSDESNKQSLDIKLKSEPETPFCQKCC